MTRLEKDESMAGRGLLLFLVSFMAFFWIVSPLAADAADGRERSFNADLKLVGEYDDNVRLEDEGSGDVEEDFVYHVIPHFEYRHPYREHRLYLDLSGDYREGTKTDLSDVNMSAKGRLDLKFTGGLFLSLLDEYTRTSFDQELYEEAGRSDSQSNRYGVGLGFVRNRFSLQGSYYRKWQEFEDTAQKTERDIDDFSLKAEAPATERTSLYAKYEYREQFSAERNQYNYDSERSVAGVLWKGQARVTFWAEAGYQDLQYDFSGFDDYSEFVGEFGTEIEFTPQTDGSLIFGHNGYGEFYGSLSMRNQMTQNITASVRALRETVPSFSRTSTSQTFRRELIGLQVVSRLVERLVLTFDGSFQRQKPSGVDFETEITTGKLSLDYAALRWFSVGSSVQYSLKDTSDETNEFDNTRVGVYVKATL